MAAKKYRLRKDLPDHSAGTEFVYDKSRGKYKTPTEAINACDPYSCFMAQFVENNPEWFEEVKEDQGKYRWEKRDGVGGNGYIIIHGESGEHIAKATSAEKAHFLVTAANAFKYDTDGKLWFDEALHWDEPKGETITIKLTPEQTDKFFDDFNKATIPIASKAAAQSSAGNKDWEILEMCAPGGRPHKYNDPKYSEKCELIGCKIHSVKRLSDGEVFSVGDEVDFRSSGETNWLDYWQGKIISIKPAYTNKDQLEFEIYEERMESAVHKFIANIRHKNQSKEEKPVPDDEPMVDTICREYNLFTQPQLDKAIQKAFAAGRHRIGGAWNNQIRNWTYPTLQDYLKDPKNNP